MNREAPTDVPVHALIAARWSPYGYSERAVADADLRALFEAARWAPSSYNEQPWRFVIALRSEQEAFARLLEILVEGNRTWAQHAPVLAIATAARHFARNGADNRHAFHDVGLAVATLTLEATARGLAVHQMAGIQPDVARTQLDLPDGVEAITAFTIGYAGARPELPATVAARDEAPRTRRPITQQVFRGRFGAAAFP